MKTVIQYIREHLERQIRPESKPKPDLASLRATEWVPLFEQYMRNRLVMGAMRYQTFEEKYKGHTYDCLGYVRDKLDEYKQTHNLECLVDAANLLMIEFATPQYPDVHFTPGDDTAHVKKRKDRDNENATKEVH